MVTFFAYVFLRIFGDTAKDAIKNIAENLAPYPIPGAIESLFVGLFALVVPKLRAAFNRESNGNGRRSTEASDYEAQPLIGDGDGL